MDEPDTSVAETHISRVFLAGDRAYKLLKPVSLGFLDFSSRSERLAATRRELELNRRLAPDVYLGLADVHEGDELVDQMLVMRRMPSDRRLSDLLRDAARSAIDVRSCLEAVARRIAALHQEAAPLAGTEAAMATRDAVAGYWEDDFDAIEPHLGTVIDADEFDEVRGLARAYLDAGEALFARRIESGWVRDGHGDLRAEDVFCLDDGPRILDCLAFDDRLRIGDVLADIAFLVMDVHHLAGPELADEVMTTYQRFTGETHPASLADFYVAYRAHVRVKVACLRVGQGAAMSGDLSLVAEARALHRLALDQLRAGRLTMVVIGGGPGSGKSTVARRLSDELGLAVVSSDEIRKEQAGLGHLDDAAADPGAGIYAPDRSDRVYDEMLREADVLLRSGESLVLDASWTAGDRRASARSVARERRARLVEIECSVATDVAKARVAQRQGDPSDATAAVIDHLAATADPWPEAIRLPTDRPPDEVVARALSLLDLEESP